MAYPEDIDEFREIENLPGLTYDPADRRTLFMEDLQELRDSIVRIEQTLGLNPQGSDDDVVDRLSRVDTGTLHKTGDETKTGELDMQGRLSISGAGRVSGIDIDSGAEQTLTLAAAVTSNTSTSWTVTQGSIDILIELGLPLVARMASGEQVVIRALNDTTNVITVVRRKFGTTPSTYTNGTTFVTDMTSNYLIRADSKMLVSLVSYTGPNIYLPPVTDTETNVRAPDDGALFLIKDAAGGQINIRVYTSGINAEAGYLLTNMDRLFGSVLVTYSAATEQYQILAQNVNTQRLDVNSGVYLGYNEFQGTVSDPNGIIAGNIGDTYVNSNGGPATTFYVNTDGNTAWDALG